MSFVVPEKIHLQLGMKHVIWTGQVVNNNFNSLHHKTLKVVILPNKNIKKFINGNYFNYNRYYIQGENFQFTKKNF